MGWFFNTNTAARQYNNDAMLSFLANIDHKGKTLGSYYNETTNTIQQLEQVSSLTQQSSALGQKLAQTLTSLKSHSTDLQEQIEDSMAAFCVTNLMVEQYKLPRIKRTVDISGDAMAGGALVGNITIQAELPVLQERHANEMAKVQRLINEVAHTFQKS